MSVDLSPVTSTNPGVGETAGPGRPSRFAAPRMWWLSPVIVSLLIAAASIVPTAMMSDVQFRSLWKTPKSLTGDTLLLFGCGAAALAFGALIAIAAAPATRRPSGPWPNLNEQSLGLVSRASTVLTALAVIGYCGFGVLIVRAGLSPLELLWSPSGYGSGLSVRDTVGTVPGVTTLTQCGVAAVITSTVVLVRGFSRAELIKLVIVVGLAVPRAYIFSERLAILELVVPIAVILAAQLSTGRPWRRRAVQLLPVITLPAVIAVFGFFEYFRSWTYYRTHVSSSFAEFAVSRFVGYYATALNNSHLVLQHMQWPNRIPYETMEALWTAPGVKQAHLYQMLGGRPPPFSSGTDSMYFGVLDHFANPEFNNEGGYVTAFIDYGRWGGIVYFLLGESSSACYTGGFSTDGHSVCSFIQFCSWGYSSCRDTCIGRTPGRSMPPLAFWWSPLWCRDPRRGAVVSIDVMRVRSHRPNDTAPTRWDCTCAGP